MTVAIVCEAIRRTNMQIEVVCRDGVFVPTVPLNVKRDRIVVDVEISDNFCQALSSEDRGIDFSKYTKGSILERENNV